MRAVKVVPAETFVSNGARFPSGPTEHGIRYIVGFVVMHVLSTKVEVPHRPDRFPVSL